MGFVCVDSCWAAVQFSPFERDEKEQHRTVAKELKRELESGSETIRPR